jgi:hypothetical protein
MGGGDAASGWEAMVPRDVRRQATSGLGGDPPRVARMTA